MAFKVIGESNDLSRLSIDKLKIDEDGSVSTVIKEAERDPDKPFTIDDYNEMMKPSEEDSMTVESLEDARKKKEQQNNQTTTEQDTDSNPGGIKIAMRPQKAVDMMRVDIPESIVNEINQYIDDTHILSGQLETISHNIDDEFGSQIATIIRKLVQEFIFRSVDKKSSVEITSLESVHSYGGEQEQHDMDPFSVSCILYLKKPDIDMSNKGDKFTWAGTFPGDDTRLIPPNHEFVEPQSGVMLVYPSWVKRETTPFDGDAERRTLSAKATFKLL